MFSPVLQKMKQEMKKATQQARSHPRITESEIGWLRALGYWHPTKLPKPKGEIYIHFDSSKEELPHLAYCGVCKEWAHTSLVHLQDVNPGERLSFLTEEERKLEGKCWRFCCPKSWFVPSHPNLKAWGLEHEMKHREDRFWMTVHQLGGRREEQSV